ncbi:hypothetical protein EDD15DRAFT_2373199 [Pisolithus albus]|nr:hypothetical protein EDD15DRAFT_2373199 [Pisolithus albus]
MLWVANNRRDSLIAVKVGFGVSASPTGDLDFVVRREFFKQVIEFSGPKPTIHFVILSADADPTGETLTGGNKIPHNATEGQPKHVLGVIGMAQIQTHNDEVPAAIHTLDTLIQPPNPQRSVEATVMLTSLCAHPRTEVSSSNAAQEKVRAPAATADDLEMHLEVARLWQEEQPEQTVRALREVLRISEASGQIDLRLLNNLVSVAAPERQCRLHEDKEDLVMAKEAYDKLLTCHPEYVDARIGQAHMLANLNQVNDAHEILKHALTAHTSNLNLCAYYTSFLIQNNQLKVAKDFVYATLKDYERSDVHSLCAAALTMYNQSHENREPNPKALEERKHGFQRAVETYQKALQFDPLCAVAAQGLAIATAEDTLGALSGVTVASIMEETQLRIKNAHDALDVFAKIRESLNDRCVYVNIGHCYYARDEFDHAIESYETASTRYYYGHNTSVLLYLCRSRYAKASKEQSFPAMNTALKYAQMALHLQPSDKATMYSVVTIQQKATELLFELPPSKRSRRDLVAIGQATLTCLAIHQPAFTQSVF